MAVREVVDPVEGHAAVDCGVDALEAGLVLGGVRREGDERGQVRARRAAGHDQKVGIGAVQGAVLADPGDGALQIDQVIEELKRKEKERAPR